MTTTLFAAKVPRRLHVVVHAKDDGRGIFDAGVAIGAGARCLALIDQYCSIEEVQWIAAAVRRRIPRREDVQITVNHLMGTPPLWLDDLNCDSWVDVLSVRTDSVQPVGEYTTFGGMAFKYQYDPQEVVERHLRDYAADPHPRLVVTTSGSATGVPPSTQKIDWFRSILPEDARLAIASGMTVDNLPVFLPLATDFFVGTALEDHNLRVDRDKVREMVDLIRTYNESLGVTHE